VKAGEPFARQREKLITEARRTDQPMLAYMLDMAKAEAESQLRQFRN
jgi:hypothetical protein